MPGGHVMMVPKAGVPLILHDPRPQTLPIHNIPEMDDLPTDQQEQPRRPSRPDTARASTDPTASPTLLLQGYKDSLSRPSSSHRNRSPYSRTHLRSRSSGGAPLMTRAHSMPSPYLPRPFDSPGSGSLSPSPAGAQSPMRVPARARSPFKADEGKGWTEAGAGIESIQEDSELDLRPRGQLVQPTALHAARGSGAHHARRRPASPLYQAPGTQQQQAPTSVPATAPGADPPTPHQQQKYNEAYPTPTLHHHSSTSTLTSLSSFPSTPTSARSRSPSISSLDTIEDEPEQEVLESLKEDSEEEEGGRRRSLDGGERRSVGAGFGFTRGRSERKRWSVCGGERRGDLDLETIWED